MIRHFAADGTVKREWAEGLYASPAVRDGKTFTQVYGSNSVLAEIELGDGEQIGEAFDPAITAAQAAREVILQAAAENGIEVHESQLAPPMPIVAADVHPIESALSAVAAADDLNLSLTGRYTIDHGMTPQVDPVTEADAERLRAIGIHTEAEGSKLIVSLSQIPVEIAPEPAAAEVAPQEAQAAQSTEAAQIPPSEARNG